MVAFFDPEPELVHEASVGLLPPDAHPECFYCGGTEFTQGLEDITIVPAGNHYHCVSHWCSTCGKLAHSKSTGVDT